ncbi:hypothetical protein GE21DRAFT_2239 [Neurospora crassa]|uniref:Transmembrane protein n=1 Tax=Neurospora crassa (strain ATCC 24698 / 74-OR23-1A / CBS 708.71 / DSM 1257 / FGSC 987) TaxID=367110 RepID=V5IQM0_NEUCR|nr:hypothetical protein NCU16460 [Neurospora crassa OR74A]ESA44337.1 hypothetical protein NCU16460 [Neurospora crassa OR74A]KHE85071.1 hypothetical protein GE21DRAFT_2239 [Neurospora crassa]|eukprot:XP_011393427.1 hypothetical protein NCU16460 [Neurospora crassa OR74A]
MGFSGFPSFRLFTFDTLSPLSRHTQTFAAHAPKAVLTSRDPALVPGRSNSFLILCSSFLFYFTLWIIVDFSRRALLFFLLFLASGFDVWRFFTLFSRLMCCFGYWRKRSSGVYCVTLAERLAWRDMAGHGEKGAIPGLDFFWTHLNWRGAMEYSLSNVLTLVQRVFLRGARLLADLGPVSRTYISFLLTKNFRGFSWRFRDITATHIRVIDLSGNQTRMVYRLQIACLTTQSLFLCIILRSTTLFMNETLVFCPS